MHGHHRRLLEAAGRVGGIDVSSWGETLLAGRGPAPRGAGLVLDASFHLPGHGGDTARFSVNDRGAQETFRGAALEIVRRLHPTHAAAATAFWDQCAPGRVQTTLGLKATPGNTRISVYLEELSMLPDGGHSLREATGASFGASEPPEGPPVAVALDLSDEVTFKEYAAVLDRPGADGGPPLPGSLEAFRRRLPFRRGVRRMLWARRWSGTQTGRKLLWVPEVRHDGSAPAAWDTTLHLLGDLKLPPSRGRSAVRRLAEDGAFYPDLVSLDAEADGTPVGATVYVAVRGG